MWEAKLAAFAWNIITRRVAHTHILFESYSAGAAAFCKRRKTIIYPVSGGGEICAELWFASGNRCNSIESYHCAHTMDEKFLQHRGVMPKHLFKTDWTLWEFIPRGNFDDESARETSS